MVANDSDSLHRDPEIYTRKMRPFEHFLILVIIAATAYVGVTHAEFGYYTKDWFLATWVPLGRALLESYRAFIDAIISGTGLNAFALSVPWSVLLGVAIPILIMVGLWKAVPRRNIDITKER